jgi:NAD(P)-dependent dehydrogenase (short-subunit alcohol dehydrogenase family)
MITGDNGGVGHAIIDRLAELGWNINRQDNGAKSSNPLVWANKGSEVWDYGRKQIEDRLVILPNDDTLKEQLLNRRWQRKSDGRLLLESKDTLRKRGGHSPDRADAVLGAMMPAPAIASAPIDYLFDNNNGDFSDDYDQADDFAQLGIQV